MLQYSKNDIQYYYVHDLFNSVSGDLNKRNIRPVRPISSVCPRGPKGLPGNRGQPGAKGVDGVQGVQGHPGLPGNRSSVSMAVIILLQDQLVIVVYGVLQAVRAVKVLVEQKVLLVLGDLLGGKAGQALWELLENVFMARRSPRIAAWFK